MAQMYLARVESLARIDGEKRFSRTLGSFFVARAEQRPLKGRMRPKEIAWFSLGLGKNHSLGARSVEGGWF